MKDDTAREAALLSYIAVPPPSPFTLPVTKTTGFTIMLCSAVAKTSTNLLNDHPEAVGYSLSPPPRCLPEHFKFTKPKKISHCT